jgi:hypothetical protein
MVVNGHGQHFLGVLLAYDEFIEELVDFSGVRKVFPVPGTAFLQLFTNDIVAELYALIADINTGPGNELTDFVLALAAE